MRIMFSAISNVSSEVQMSLYGWGLLNVVVSPYTIAETGSQIAAAPWQQLACHENVYKMQTWNPYVLETVRSHHYCITIPQIMKF